MSREPHEKCTEHTRPYCWRPGCKEEERRTDSTRVKDNAGSLSLTTEGTVAIGLGGGLAIDPSDGSIGFQVGGFTIDTA